MVSKFIAHKNVANLLHLIRFCLAVVALQIDLLLHTPFPEDVVTAPHSFLKPKVEQQRA